MLLTKITLKNFRNFQKETFEFSPFVTIITGENATGKTNLIEAVFFAINGSGFRETKEQELINFHKNETSSVETVFAAGDQKQEFKIILQGKETKTEKSFFLNKVKKSFIFYFKNQTKAVLFSPDQLSIITGSPAQRRDYLSSIISFYDPAYRKRLFNYEKALRRRNKILEYYESLTKLKEETKFWNDYLEIEGSYITQKREEYVEFLNKNDRIDSKEFRVKYLKNEFNKERLEKVSEKEILIRRTLIGPQKDDFEIYINDNPQEGLKNTSFYGSRSEQRLAILWLKMNEIKFFEDFFGRKPILLLDDIFSELDLKNKKLVLELIKRYQTILTTTEERVIDLAKMQRTIINI